MINPKKRAIDPRQLQVREKDTRFAAKQFAIDLDSASTSYAEAKRLLAETAVPNDPRIHLRMTTMPLSIFDGKAIEVTYCKITADPIFARLME